MNKNVGRPAQEEHLKSTRTNTSLPRWLKIMADENGIKYSELLRKAVIEELEKKGKL